MLFSIGAIAGVLVFLKTRVAPPSAIKPIDQYSIALDKAYEDLESKQNFAENRESYLKVEDLINRFVQEEAMSNEVADDYRLKIIENHGGKVIANAYGFFGRPRPSWPEDQLYEVMEYIYEIEDYKLSTGKSAATSRFMGDSERIKVLVQKYNEALTLSRSTEFSSIENAKEKISKADEYKNADYLRNNDELVDALDALPSKIAKSHYNYVWWHVNELTKYRNLTEEEFDIEATNVNNIIEEYRNTHIYSEKPDISNMDSLFNDYWDQAKYYYKSEQLYNQGYVY